MRSLRCVQHTRPVALWLVSRSRPLLPRKDGSDRAPPDLKGSGQPAGLSCLGTSTRPVPGVPFRPDHLGSQPEQLSTLSPRIANTGSPLPAFQNAPALVSTWASRWFRAAVRKRDPKRLGSPGGADPTVMPVPSPWLGSFPRLGSKCPTMGCGGAPARGLPPIRRWASKAWYDQAGVFAGSPCTKASPARDGLLDGGHPDKSFEQRLSLTRSWQQGHSTHYSTASEPSRLQGIYPEELVELPCVDHRPGMWPDRRDPPGMLLGWHEANLSLVG